MPPLLADFFCGAGAAGSGYDLAGFEVVGFDINPQPNYPFEFVQADALTYPLTGFDGFAALTGSPPCQDHSETAVLTSGSHGTGWMLQATIGRFRASGKPWVVENVTGSALPKQDDLFGDFGLELCGCMFERTRGLLYEPRRFQSSFPVPQPPHVRHIWPTTKMGRRPVKGECMQITGHFTDADEGRRRMGCPWMTRDELAQAIPPVYTEYIGRHLLDLWHRGTLPCRDK